MKREIVKSMAETTARRSHCQFVTFITFLFPLYPSSDYYCILISQNITLL